MAEEEDGEVKKAIEHCLNVQSMIDINADHLDGLRTQCSTSAELTQNEIRTFESKLVKLFSRQLVTKRKCPNGLTVPDLKRYPQLKQWLRVVGLSRNSTETICKAIGSFDVLFKYSEVQVKDLLHASEANEEEIRRLLTALRNLKTFTERLMLGNVSLEMDLHWDSWDRSSNGISSTIIPVGGSSPRVTRNRVTRSSVPSEEVLKSLKSSPLSPPQSASAASCPWSPSFGSKDSEQVCGTLSPPSTLSLKERRITPPPTPPVGTKKSGNNKFPTTPPPIKRHQTNLLQEPYPLTKSKSHEEHLSHRVEPVDSNQTNYDSLPQQHRRRLRTEPGLSQTSPVISPNRSPPVTCLSPDQTDSCFGDETHLPVPRSPRATGGMVHVIHHRFRKTMKVTGVICQLCEKPMYIGFKCSECKYFSHRDCVDKVPPSCGLTNEMVEIFKEKMQSELSGRHSPSPLLQGHMGLISPSSVKSENLYRGNRRSKGRHSNKPLINVPPFGGPDSSSNNSSCNSSTPSSPALIVTSAQTPPSASKLCSFNFPDVISLSSCSNPGASDGEKGVIIETKSLVDPEIVETQKSNDSDKTVSGTSGSTSTDSEKTLAGRIDSQDSQISDSMDMDPNERSWPRQNSLTTLREWDIPYDELKIEEEIGTGRFGTVFRGNWYGNVAIKRLNMNNALDDRKAIEAFKQEVATFRKTRHENLVLFMGACMKPPHLAIITSLCKGMTLFTHIHVRKDKFNFNRTIVIAQQIAQGMGYLHARGIVHKDLKTKNIFYENGKVVITDFGLFSVTKLCHGNRYLQNLLSPENLCYFAPELVRSLRAENDQESEDLPFSVASDVFAFGTVWYELLLFEWPFKGQPSEVIIWQVGKGVKQCLTNLQASKELKELLMNCWTFHPKDRCEFSKLLDHLSRLPKKRLQRSPSHPTHLLRSAESMF